MTDGLAIVHFVESLENGGLERVVVDLATAQHKRGIQVSVACLFRHGLLADELKAQGVDVLCLERRSGLDKSCIERLRSQLIDSKATVLHTHNQMAHYYGVFASRGLSVRRVNTRHGMGAHGAFSRREALYRMSLPFTDAVVSVCQANQQLMRRKLMWGARHSVVQPNGIRLEHILTRDSDGRAYAREQLGLSEGQFCFGTVARLNLMKNQALLLRAFAQLPADKSRLVLIGDGPERENLEQLAAQLDISSTTHFLGLRNDVAQLLCGMDVFVLPSLSEGYSLALLEASAAALPIIATDIGGNSEIVAQGTSGLLVPSEDQCALADAMQAMVAEPSRVEQYGRAGRESTLRVASLDAMVDGYTDIYLRNR